MNMVGGVWVSKRLWCLLLTGVKPQQFLTLLFESAIWEKIYREGAQLGKSNLFSIGSYCTAESFCLLLIYHTALTRKRCVSLRLYLFGKEGQISSRPEIWPWTVLVTLSAACQPLLPMLSCRNACALLLHCWPRLCCALFVFCLENSWLQLHLAIAGLQPTLGPSRGTSPHWPGLTGAWWGCVSWERGEEGPAIVDICCHSWSAPPGLHLTLTPPC